MRTKEPQQPILTRIALSQAVPNQKRTAEEDRGKKRRGMVRRPEFHCGTLIEEKTYMRTPKNATTATVTPIAQPVSLHDDVEAVLLVRACTEHKPARRSKKMHPKKGDLCFTPAISMHK